MNAAGRHGVVLGSSEEPHEPSRAGRGTATELQASKSREEGEDSLTKRRSEPHMLDRTIARHPGVDGI
jgi:hypothetical protein